MSEAFHLFGQGEKLISSNEGNAQWVLSVPIGTFAVTAKVEIRGAESFTSVSASLNSEGPGIIASETRPDSVSIQLTGEERVVATLQGVVATNNPATVRLRCRRNPGGGSAVIRRGTITAIRLDDPNHLHIEDQNVQ